MEVVLPESAELTEIQPALLAYDILPGLWENSDLQIGKLYNYFRGENVVQVQKEGYMEPMIIPKAAIDIVDAAIQEAVEQGILWLISGPASILSEEIPAGLIQPDAQLNPPPEHLSIMDVLPERLPEAWKGETTSVLAIAVALSSKIGKPLPWNLVQEALNGAFHAHYLERTINSKPWPCDYGDAQWIKVKIPTTPPPTPLPPPPPSGVLVAEADLEPSQIQDLADMMGELVEKTVGHKMKIHLRIEVDQKISKENLEKVQQILKDIDEDMDLR